MNKFTKEGVIMQSCDTCFAINRYGECTALEEKLMKDGYCPFYKEKEAFERKIRELDNKRSNHYN